MLAKGLRGSYFIKIVSVVLTFTFLSLNNSFAIPENEATDRPDNVSEEHVSVEDIGIAIDCGTIKSKYNGGNQKVIVHIQDAHCNYEAQSNINKILDQVTKECGINMISVEGAEGIVDTAWFRAFPDAEIRKEVADYFMKKGEITGAEFFSINSDYDGTIFGAETRDYYIKNLKAFTEVYPYKDSIEKYLKNLETIANRLKTVVYSPELKELDLKIRDFDSKDLELSDFAAYLAKECTRHKIDIKGFEDFKKLLQTLEYEDKIDFDIVDKERSDYIDALSKKLSKEEMADLVAESIKFKKGHTKSVDFYTYLREKAKEQEIDIIHEYPNLFYYYIYTKLYEGINNENLFKDLDKIQTALKEKLFKNDTQRRLDKYAEMVVMFVNLVNIELTNDDYDTFKTYREEFSLEDVLDFFSNLSERYGLGYSMDILPQQISDNLPNMVNFYEIAMKRDKALIDNTLERMKKEGKDRCVLIAGGFHTRGIKDLLKKQGVSYVVVTPKITKDVETPYIKVLTNQRTSLEDIITESAAMPGINVNNNRSEAVATPKGKLLSPIVKIGYSINLYLDDEKALDDISNELGAVNGKTIADATEETYKDIVNMLVDKWVEKQSPEQNDAVSPQTWKALTDNWRSLSGAFQLKMERLSDEKLNDKIVKSVIEAFGRHFDKSPGSNAVRNMKGDFDSYEKLNDAERTGLNISIAPLMLKGEQGHKPIIDMQAEGIDPVTGKKVVETVQVVPLINWREQIENDNYENGDRVPMDVMVHPGRGLEHTGKYIYIDSRMLDALTQSQIQRLVNHEYAHFLYPEKSESDVIKDLSDPLDDVRRSFAKTEADRLAAKAESNRNLLKHSKAMSNAASLGEGPEVAIVVATSQAEADFWQNRLTGEDNQKGSGVAVKKDAYVLAVTEENWDGGAGNGLGTLNGFVQAARKAADFGILPGVKATDDIEKLVDSFLDYLDGKTTFMYHTAGKGTRTAPIPGAEINSKPSIKLPKTIEVDGEIVPLTILESVLMQTSIYADSRKNRMGVFWGDQIIINENDVTYKGNHHVEIFGQLVPLDEGISAYGVLIPGEEGDCKQREKLSLEQVKALLPDGQDSAYKSIGSFTQSLAFLRQLLNLEMDTLKTGKGSLNTDPHWWQPLTSERQDYIDTMVSKGKSAEEAAAQWDKMDKMKEIFYGTEDFKKSGLSRMVGFTDVGENSLWWDYGQNKLFLANMQLLTQASPEAKAARIFFGVEKPAQQDEAVIVKNYRDAQADEWAWSNKTKEVKKALIEKMAEELTLSVGYLRVEDFTTPIDMFGGKDLYSLLQWAKQDTNARTDQEALENLLGFVGIDSRGWIDGDSIVLPGVDVKNSVIENSTIKSGYLKNSVVINSTLSHVEAEDAIIIGSTVISLKAFGGVVYNVVQGRASVRPEQVLANVFHPGLGRIDMRTTTTRNGEWDFKVGPEGKGGAWVFDNLYKYSEIHKDNQGVTIEQVNKLRQKEIDDLLSKENEILSSTAMDNYSNRVKNLAARRTISEPEARLTIAHRLLTFRDVDYFTVDSYAEAFSVTQDIAEQELETLASTEKEETLPGIQKIRNIVFDTDKADYIEIGQSIYAAVPEENREQYIEEMRKLGFGTSGLRSDVDLMTDLEVYLNTRGYIKFLNKEAGLKDGDIISITGDLRPSTPRLMKAIGKAVEDEAANLNKTLVLDFGGRVSSPAGAYRGITKNSFSIVVTGSHIPFYMNGIKYYMKDGEEVLKVHEKPILKAVTEARAEEKLLGWKEAQFDDKGMFKVAPEYDITENQDVVRSDYRQRYIDNFRPNMLKGMNIVFWKHSAVGADDVDIVLNELGARTVTAEQDKSTFVSVDTEKVKPPMAKKLADLSENYVKNNNNKKPDAIIFTDGDSDRPGVADENGQFLTGDKLGLLVTKYLMKAIPEYQMGSINSKSREEKIKAGTMKADEKFEEGQLVVALPISTNFGVIDELESMGIKVIKTKIGSPHVVKAMNDAQAQAAREGKNIHVLGWEANGGFLLGSDFEVPGTEDGILTRLATRDAMLPILAAFDLAQTTGRPLSQLFAEEIRPVANHTGGYEKFKEDLNVDRDEAMEVRKGVLSMLTPQLEDKDVVAIDYRTMKLQRLVTSEVDGKQVQTFEREEISADEISDKDLEAWMNVKELLETVFTSDKKFGDIVGLDIMDGIQVIFEKAELDENGEPVLDKNNQKIMRKEISHIRPSGNDPVFRNYAMSEVFDSVEKNMERAVEIANIGEKDIIPTLAKKVYEQRKNSALGSNAVRTMPAKDQPVAKVVEAVLKGDQPVFMRAYKEEKETWGKLDPSTGQIIGEYWYGYIGDKSAIVVVDGAEAPMSELMKYVPDNVLGESEVRMFGAMLPLTKILTPRNRLSMQFHDEKNELWVVTAVDKQLAGQKPAIVLGFSQDSVDKYGKSVNAKYGKVLVVYGEKLNALKDYLEDTAPNVLKETGDIVKAAEELADSDTETKMLLDEVKTAREALEYFYNYRKVKPGDVIPIPAGTSHALTPGIDVLEPQIAGETQSLEDGGSYPVRYAFPGHYAEGQKKYLDIDRVGEMTPEVVKEALPIEIEKTETYSIERLPGDFESKGLEVKRYNFTENGEIEFTGNDRMHVLTIVSETGTAKIEINGRQFDLPQAKPGADIPLIPATVKNFKIIATKDVQIVDTTMPEIKTSEVVLPNDSEPIAATGEKSYNETVVMDTLENTTNALDRLTIIDSAEKLPIIRDREHTINVLEGKIKIVTPGIEDIVLDVSNEPQNITWPNEYNILSIGDVPAVVEIDYEKDDQEKTAYAVYELVKEHIPTLKKNKVDLILAKEFFAKGDGVGSSIWFEKEINKLLGVQPGEDNLVEIKTYNNILGMEGALKTKTRKDADPEVKVVLGVTADNINDAKTNDSIQQQLRTSDIRIMSLPGTVSEGEYVLTREIALTGLMQAALTKEEIASEAPSSLVLDMALLMAQMTGKRKVEVSELLYLLPYMEASAGLKTLNMLMDDEVFGVEQFLVRVLGLTLKDIEPYDPRHQLEMRKKVMYSV